MKLITDGMGIASRCAIPLKERPGVPRMNAIRQSRLIMSPRHRKLWHPLEALGGGLGNDTLVIARAIPAHHYFYSIGANQWRSDWWLRWTKRKSRMQL